MKKCEFGILFFVGLLAIIVVTSCNREPEVIDISNEPYVLDIGNFPAPNLIPDNPLTREGVRLGRMLFYEKMLSKDNTMACASCHHQQFAFTDTATFSRGVTGQVGSRQAMTIFNLAWHANSFFWDGRAHLLRDQSLMPIEDKLEMNETLPNVVAKLKGNPIYPLQFLRAFGTTDITPELMSKAMEQFMNSIVSHASKYDEYLAGTATLTNEEERGRFLFFGVYNPASPTTTGAECVACHKGSNFENNRYMGNGLDTDADFKDMGREIVTGNPAHRAWFKTPSLRNVAITAPYMHDGRFKTLEEVVDHYNLLKGSSTLDVRLQTQLNDGGLKLSNADKNALVAFLKTLTDKELMTNPEYSNPF